MIPVKLIIIVGLVCLFVGVTFFRMYLRTDLKGYLLISLGAVIGLIGGIISYLGNLIMSNKTMVDVIGETIMIIGIILSSSGPIILCTQVVWVLRTGNRDL